MRNQRYAEIAESLPLLLLLSAAQVFPDLVPGVFTIYNSESVAKVDSGFRFCFENLNSDYKILKVFLKIKKFTPIPDYTYLIPTRMYTCTLLDILDYIDDSTYVYYEYVHRNFCVPISTGIHFKNISNTQIKIHTYIHRNILALVLYMLV